MAVTIDGTTGVSLVQDGTITPAKLNGVVQGITGVDNWYVSLNTSDVSASDLTENLSRSSNAGIIGSGMTESSGIFTFPDTGYWLIIGTFTVQARGAALIQGVIDMKFSTDSGSNYVNLARNEATADSTSEVQTITVSGVADVTSTANSRLKFSMEVLQGSQMRVLGNSDTIRSGITFVRLGDT